MQDKRGQATYPQIKEYVLEQTGLKVSSLYISQIKRKCGLDVGDSYNKPLEYAQLVLGEDIQAYLSGKSEHRLADQWIVSFHHNISFQRTDQVIHVIVISHYLHKYPSKNCSTKKMFFNISSSEKSVPSVATIHLSSTSFVL